MCFSENRTLCSTHPCCMPYAERIPRPFFRRKHHLQCGMSFPIISKGFGKVKRISSFFRRTAKLMPNRVILSGSVADQPEMLPAFWHRPPAVPLHPEIPRCSQQRLFRRCVQSGCPHPNPRSLQYALAQCRIAA